MPVVKTVDGKFYRVDADQEVTAEDLQNEVSELQTRAANIEAVLAPATPDDNPAPQEQPAPAADPTPAQPEEPVQPEAPVQAEIVDATAEPVVDAPVLQ